MNTQMIKFIGILILSCSLSVYGAMLSSTLKKADLLRREIIKLLKGIERRIQYGKSPSQDFFSKGEFPLLYERAIIGISENPTDLSQCFNALNGVLTGADSQTLSEFFSCLGRSAYRELELKNCRYAIDYFEKTQTEIERETATKIILYKKLGILAGILCAIIFI